MTFKNSIKYRARCLKHALIGARNNYDAGKVNRITGDWNTTVASQDQLLRVGLRNMRSRSRDLCINNDYARSFLWILAKHVTGPDGIQVKNKAMYADGVLDKTANDKIQEAWLEFNEKGNYEVTGKLSGRDADRLFIQTVARDGEALVRFLPGWDNEWGFTLQFIEADRLDETLNVPQMNSGNQIRMSVEFDSFMRPVAYHILRAHPGDYSWTWQGRHYDRIPASQIIHSFIMDRIDQSRGAPWMHSAMTRLNNLGAYEEAEIIGARIGASAMGIWEPAEWADSTVSPGQTTKDEEDNPIMEVEPGIMIKAPHGHKFNAFNPKRPSGQFAPFMKSSLRGIASGLLVGYNTLASDLEGVNYSSLRSGALEERDMYKLIQSWMIENYKKQVFRRWLRRSLLNGAIALPVSKFKQLHKPKFIGRRWAWVDPKKDMEANKLALDEVLTTRSDLAERQGDDFEEILKRRQEEDKMMEQYGQVPGDAAANKAADAALVAAKKTKEEELETEDDDDSEIDATAPGKGAASDNGKSKQ